MIQRLAQIEASAKRHGLSVILDKREEAGYNAPSLEEDMADMSPFVWGSITPSMELDSNPYE